MINLSELEQKAKAATFVDMRDGMRAYTAMEFNESMSPTTALALIRVARAAIEVSEHHAGKSVDELKEALKEIQ